MTIRNKEMKIFAMCEKLFDISNIVYIDRVKAKKQRGICLVLNDSI